MSSLKKHAFSPAPVPIALQDFAPNVELTYRDHTYTLRDNTVRATLTSAVIDTPLHHNHYFTPPTSHYIVIDKLNFSTTPSTPCLQAAAQPSSDSHLKSQLTNTKTHRNLQENNADFTALHTPDFWLLTQQDRILVKGGLRISLTTIESALMRHQTKWRVCYLPPSRLSSEISTFSIENFASQHIFREIFSSSSHYPL